MKTHNPFSIFPGSAGEYEERTIEIKADKDIILDTYSKFSDDKESIINIIKNPQLIGENDKKEDVFKDSKLTMVVKCRFVTE